MPSQEPTDSPQPESARPVRHRVLRTPEDLNDPVYRAGVIGLLGGLAYGELKAFSSIVYDGDRAPGIEAKISLSRIAVAEFGHFELLVARIEELGGHAQEAMREFAPALDEWHARTQPKSWLEGLMKIYAGAAIANDFYRECAQIVDPATGDLINRVLEDSGHAAYAEQELRAAIARDPREASKLALWGRRLVGEALTQAQHVAASNDLVGDAVLDDGAGHGFDLAELMDVFARITDAHRARMDALGLTA